MPVRSKLCALLVWLLAISIALPPEASSAIIKPKPKPISEDEPVPPPRPKPPVVVPPPAPPPPPPPPAPPPPPPVATFPIPIPLPPAHHHTPTAVVEAAMDAVFEEYIADLEQANSHYFSSLASNDQIAWDLADDTLYLEQIRAELKFWDRADYWSKAIGVTAWAAISARVATRVAEKSPVTQARVAAILAAIIFIQAESTANYIADKKAQYELVQSRLGEAMGVKLRYLLWQQDYGGQGQPPPTDYGTIFAGCTIETTCVDAWVCTQNSGSSRDCEKQVKCSDRITKC